MTSLYNRRARAAAVVILLVLTVLCGRLIQLQGMGANAAAAARNGRLTTIPLLADRGEIMDANGVPMAQSVERRNVFVDQTVVGEEREVNGEKRVGAERAASDLAGVLGVTQESLLPKLRGDRQFVYIAKRVTPDVWRAVQALKIPGVGSQKTYVRAYPGGVVGGNVLGFVSGSPDGIKMGHGQAGVEQMLEKGLAGRNGSMSYERGLKGQLIPTAAVDETPAVNGATVGLTIDADLQYYAQQAITAQTAATRAAWGAVIVMNPKTGDILALADSPSVDPNNPGATDAAGRGSNALGAIFEPGSTAKLITAAAAMEEGLVHPEDHFVVKDRYVATNKEKFKDSHDHAPQKLTFAGILAESSNVGTLMVGSKLSKDTRHEYLKAFGLGQSSGLKFPGESRGILHPVKDWDGRTGLAVLFGQGVSATALQAVTPFATIANNGVRMNPRLVAQSTDANGKVTKTPISAAQRVVRPEVASSVRQMLAGVTEEGGTGTRAAIPGYQVAGKTGTSQAPSKGGYSGYTGSFIGMAPADDPELVVGVILQRPKNGYYGGTVAGPVFKDVMQYALKKYKIPPSANPYPLLPNNY